MLSAPEKLGDRQGEMASEKANVLWYLSQQRAKHNERKYQELLADGDWNELNYLIISYCHTLKSYSGSMSLAEAKTES